MSKSNYGQWRAVSMSFKFDIFHIESQGQLLWRASASDLHSAKSKVKELSAVHPGEYFLYRPSAGIRHPINPEELNSITERRITLRALPFGPNISGWIKLSNVCPLEWH
jgi:hypothetical protein